LKGKATLNIQGLHRNLNVLAAACRFAVLFGLFLYTELIFQLLTGTIGIGFLRAAFFILTGSALLTLVSLSLPKLPAMILAEAAAGLVFILSAAQLIYYKIFHEFFTIDKMGGGGNAMVEFWDILIATMRENIFGILLLLPPVLVPALLYGFRRFPDPERLPVKQLVIPVAALCLLRLALMLPAAIDPFSSLAVRYGQEEKSRVSSVREVGLAATMQLDMLTHLTPSGPSSALTPVSPPPVIAVLPSPSPPSSPIPSQSMTLLGAPDTPDLSGLPDPSPKPKWTGKVNGFDIDFGALTERDRGNKGLVQLHQYFASLEPSSQNKMTGKFEGFNVITICAEAFTKWAVCPELTPTLYMMMTQGVYFENFYSIYGGGTIGGEFALLTGMTPRGGQSWTNNASRQTLPFTIASRFLDIGIQPLAYHNGSYTFYNRNKMFPDLGYIFKARGGGLVIEDPHHRMSDLGMMEATVDEFIGMERFYVHYMTLSGHSPYTFAGNPMSAKHRRAVEHLPYSEEVRAYLASQIELDHAMAYLLQRLEEAGIAERTVIAVTSDHYPYGLPHNRIEELAGQKLDNFQLHQNTGIIYAKGMKPEVVTAPAFVPDVAPTLLNLLGMRFDSRFFSGRDVFSDAKPLVFLDSGFMTDAGHFNRGRNRFIPFEGVDVPDGYAKAMQDIIAARRSAVEQIVRLNYFDAIWEYLG
jgi:hypothetical protein